MPSNKSLNASGDSVFLNYLIATDCAPFDIFLFVRVEEMFRKVFTLLLIVLLPPSLIAQVSQTAHNPSIVFNHVTVFDVTGAPSKSDMSVILTGNLSLAIGKTGYIRVTDNTLVIYT